ncbi:MAG: prolyl oligopeptidase family serine peptidase [Polyangiaceae bacterium]|nr:prolyl oligopeptidase family serine peptidase [Polyangiaceae bacterium]
MVRSRALPILAVECLAAVALWLLSWPAAAQLSIAPDVSGYIGAWLSAGPMLDGQAREFEPRSMEPRLGAPWPGAPWTRWRLVEISDGSFDLSRGAGVRADSTIFFGAVLVAQHGFDGLLLVSADGSVHATLDGRTVWSRDSARVRGRSWDVVDLRVEPGRHTVLLAFRRRGESWACAVRLLERPTFMPPVGVRVELPGTTEVDRARLLGTMLSLEIRPGLGDAGYEPSVKLSYKRGAPRDADTTAAVDLVTPAGRVTRTFRAGGVPVGERSTSPLSVRLPLVRVSREQTLEIRARVGTARTSGRLHLSPAAVSAVARARKAGAAIRSGAMSFLADPGVALATLERLTSEVSQASADPATSLTAVGRSSGRLVKFVELLDRHEDPLDNIGLVELSRFSDLDGRPAPMLVHVPREYVRGAPVRYPLVLALHGYRGSPRGIMRAFLDTDSELPHASVAGFVAAPNAYGNSFYRGPGEYDVLDSLEWLLHTYPIDPGRVSITGVSMGGTGAAEIALKHSELFAAAAPLCGYHSYFLRRDVAGQPVQAWEEGLMRHWSPVDWAENGRALPLYVAHGTEDKPLANSRVLVDRYRELGYSIRADWPQTGHSVWKVAYHRARLWRWLSSQRRDDAALTVTVKTDALRYGQHGWLKITALERPGGMGQLQAEAVDSEHLRVHAEGVMGFEIARKPAPLAADHSIDVDLGAATLRYAPHEQIAARRVNGVWRKGPSTLPGEKRSGLEGPLHDIFAGPLVFVYGTGAASTLRANRELARAWSDAGWGVDLAYPVMADFELTDTAERGHGLFVVGTPRDNSVLASLSGRLPIWSESDRVCTRQRCYSGQDVGAVFIFPNPRTPNQYVAVLTAPTVEGLFRSLSLPRLLPDFVVYDEKASDSAGQPLLGTAQLLSAGFFERDWTLP